MSYNPHKHHRRSIRLSGYDYTQPGSYFVTLCTHHRIALFGALAGDSVILSPVGQIAERCWLALPEYFDHIRLDTMIIMPDHMHGIIVIERAYLPQGVSTNGTQRGSLAAIMQTYKSTATRRANQLQNTPRGSLWQRDYFERIIRDETDLAHVQEYIRTNPARAFAKRPLH